MNPTTQAALQTSETERKAAERGLTLLIEARECFIKSGNRRTVDRVRSAISSAKGAVRICANRNVRSMRSALTESIQGSAP